MDAVKIGEFLKSLRKDKGYTQQEVADALYVTQKTVSRWETGEGIPDINIISAVADFYEVTVDEMLRGERKKQDYNQIQVSYDSANKSSLKLFKNKMLFKQNIYFVVALSICIFFLMLGIILGLSVSGIVGLIIIPLGLIIGVGIYLYGRSEIKRIITDEDNIELTVEIEKLEKAMKKKNLLFSDILVGCITVYFLVFILLYF